MPKIAHVDFRLLPNCRRERFDLKPANPKMMVAMNKERDVGCRRNTSSSQRAKADA